MGFRQHKNHPVVSPSLPNPTWRSNRIIPEQASTPHHPACPAPAGTHGRSEPQGWEGSTSYCHTQPHRATGLPGDSCPGHYIHPRTEQELGLCSSSQGKWLVDAEGSAELGTHRSRDSWEAAGVRDSPVWLQTLCITKCNRLGELNQ